MIREENPLIASTQIAGYASLYANELVNEVLPFWESHSPDKQYGGYFSCLLPDGKVFDTDKFVWLQARQVWCLSFMQANVAASKQRLALAKQGADFLLKHGRAPNGDWYFSLRQDGQPLVQPYNIFSDCFATMAFAALDRVEQNPIYRQTATNTFQRILQRKDNPKGIWNKAIGSNRPLRNFSLPMILSNLALELEHVLGEEQVNSFLPEVVEEVMEVFYRPELGIVLENVGLNGEPVDCFEGRLVNPGHAIEAMWFMMDIGVRMNNNSLIEKAVDITLAMLEYGWDKEHGGIFYFLDHKGFPPQQLEWDQKLWWVHAETLVALAKAVKLTNRADCWQWFNKVHDYTWQQFRDEVNGGEWYGYLNRFGEVLLPLKGGKWKGCFHVPRALYQVATSFDAGIFSRSNKPVEQDATQLK